MQHTTTLISSWPIRAGAVRLRQAPADRQDELRGGSGLFGKYDGSQYEKDMVTHEESGLRRPGPGRLAEGAWRRSRTRSRTCTSATSAAACSKTWRRTRTAGSPGPSRSSSRSTRRAGDRDPLLEQDIKERKPPKGKKENQNAAPSCSGPASSRRPSSGSSIRRPRSTYKSHVLRQGRRGLLVFDLHPERGAGCDRRPRGNSPRVRWRRGPRCST
jgi:hypothetical protein